MAHYSTKVVVLDDEILNKFSSGAIKAMRDFDYHPLRVRTNFQGKFDKRYRIEGALVFMTGTKNVQPCVHCEGKIYSQAPFTECISNKEFFGSVCANCKWAEEGAYCTARTDRNGMITNRTLERLGDCQKIIDVFVRRAPGIHEKWFDDCVEMSIPEYQIRFGEEVILDTVLSDYQGQVRDGFLKECETLGEGATRDGNIGDTNIQDLLDMTKSELDKQFDDDEFQEKFENINAGKHLLKIKIANERAAVWTIIKKHPIYAFLEDTGEKNALSESAANFFDLRYTTMVGRAISKDMKPNDDDGIVLELADDYETGSNLREWLPDQDEPRTDESLREKNMSAWEGFMS